VTNFKLKKSGFKLPVRIGMFGKSNVKQSMSAAAAAAYMMMFELRLQPQLE
jgi:hypothetical protein